MKLFYFIEDYIGFTLWDDDDDDSKDEHKIKLKIFISKPFFYSNQTSRNLFASYQTVLFFDFFVSMSFNESVAEDSSRKCTDWHFYTK